MDTLTVKSHTPPGFPAVTPFITVEDPGQFAEFARSAFGAEELREQRGTTDDGKVMHVALRVEFDHAVIPRAQGGPPTARNLRLLCRVHNDLAARQTFGDHWMDQFTRGRRGLAPVQLTEGLPSG